MMSGEESGRGERRQVDVQLARASTVAREEKLMGAEDIELVCAVSLRVQQQHDGGSDENRASCGGKCTVHKQYMSLASPGAQRSLAPVLAKILAFAGHAGRDEGWSDAGAVLAGFSLVWPCVLWSIGGTMSGAIST